ncbi:MAG: PDZ domain-containing protein [Pirellulaceae bacterium]|nr:PDZ domain-containing protein [Pirellulaceae bacterium]
MRQGFAFTFSVGLILPLTVAASGATPTSSQIAGWLKQLDDENYSRREEASERLLAAGEAAIDALAQGVLSSSPEAAWRAGETLKQIAVTGNEKQLERVALALARLEKQGRPGMGKVVAEIRGRQKKLRHDRAASLIRGAGGQLVGGDGQFEEGLSLVIDGGIEVLPDVDFDIVGAAEVAEAEDELAPAAPIALRDAVKELFDEAVPRAPVAPGGDELAEEPLVEAVGVAGIALGGEDIVAADEFFMLGGVDVEDAEVAEHQVVEALTLDANWRGGDDGLRPIRDLPDIASIEIRGAKLTDEALIILAGLPKLARVHFQGTKFSHRALHRFRTAKPEAAVFCQGEAMLGIHADTTGDCVITSVYFGSGAYEAGLRDGDKILAVDGLATRDFSDLTIAVYPHAPGDKLQVEFERGGERKKTEVTLKARNVLEQRSE